MQKLMIDVHFHVIEQGTDAMKTPGWLRKKASGKESERERGGMRTFCT